MSERIAQELERLAAHFPSVTVDGRWVLLPAYPAPGGHWERADYDVAFQVPDGYPSTKPYGFFVTPPARAISGAAIGSYTLSNEPPFEGEWGKFSWDLPEWCPRTEISSGSNLLNWALSFRARLEEGP